jgi:hypothetical protein
MMNRALLACVALTALTACGGSDSTGPDVSPVTSAACPAVNFGATPAARTLAVSAPKQMTVQGLGAENARYTAEVASRGTVAYTSTWGSRAGKLGNKINIWDVAGAEPKLIDSLIVPGTVSTTGDVAISDDGSLLMVATERTGGSAVLYSLSDPRKPSLITQYHTTNTDPGVHTAKFGRIGGKLYGVLSIDPLGATPARVVIVDLSTPSAPREAYTKVIGNPYVHDVFIRDGLLFLALWDDGMQIWDLGGCGTGGTPENPVVVGTVKTLNGEAHNIWWYHDPTNGSRRYAFVGEEGPGSIGSSSRGDIHVVDISDPAKPKEVAFYHVEGAGTHNFSVDEQNGVLYAAYYNAGVRALDIRGDLGTCPGSQQNVNPSAGLTRCDLRLMGREIGAGLNDLGRGVYVWGVQLSGGALYASDMLGGLWKLAPVR